MTMSETPESEDANMNKCPMCGHVSEDGANFCSRCGTRLGVPIDTPGDNTGVIPTITEPTVAEETSPNVDLPAGVLQDIADLPAENAMLIVRRGPNLGAQFLLDQDETTAGRSTHSDIFLDDITVSRHHVKFIRQDGRMVVEDQGSLNGTYVNRTLVDGSAALRDGDEVQIGKFRMTYHTGGMASGTSGAGRD